MRGSVTLRSLSLRGESEADDAAIHRVSRGRGRVCLFAYWFTVDRHGLRPRDDKVGEEMVSGTMFVIARKARSEGRGNPSCLEGRGPVCLFAYWFTVDRHGLRPRDDKVGEGSVRFGYNTIFVIERRERSE